MNKEQVKILKFILPTTLILSLAFYLNSKQYTLYLAGALVFITLIAPSVILKLISTLEYISPYLSKLIYIPLLTLSFYLLILPVGLLRKVFGRDKINNKSFYKETKSNFDNVETEYTADDLIHPF